jgi:N-acetyl-anhydromuramyl-L-alanine amidase AmpD
VLDTRCEADGNGKINACKVYDPIRSSLCEAERLRGAAVINFELFGRNDCRAAKGSRSLDLITHVVIHNGGWNAKGNSDTWACRLAASHYSIQRDGIIYQHIGEELIAPHAKGMNEHSIGIELNLPKEAGESCNSLRLSNDGSKANEDRIRKACTPTDAQYAALKVLLDAIAKRTKVTLNEEHVVGHCESAKGKNAHGDPRAFDWGRIGLSNAIKMQQAEGTACAWYNLF